MSEYLPFVVTGLTSGSVYALAAMGLVVTYTTSGVFNFAHGAIGMIVTYIFYWLRVDVGLPTALAVALSVLVVAPAIGVVLDRVLFRRITGATPATYAVVSLGLLVALQATAVSVFGAATKQVAPIFSREVWFTIADVRVSYDQALVVLVALALGSALVLFFRSTHLGLRTRAVVDDRDLTEITGVDARRVTTFSWVLGCCFSGISGILVAPLLGLDAVLLTLLVLYSLGAAAVGRLRSLPVTYAAALGLGVAAALSTKLVATNPTLAGVPTSLPFVVLFVVLVCSRKGRFVEVTRFARERTRDVSAVALAPRFPVRALAGFMAAAVALPALLNGSQLLTATTAVAFVLVFSSLGLLVGVARQVSLCHAVFVVFGATTLSHLLSAGVPYGLALVLSGVVMVPIGAIVAIPALRLSGLFLALATFGFGVLAQDLLFPTGLAFGRDTIAAVPKPSMFTGDVAFYYFVLAVVAVGVAGIELVRSSRLGRLLRALADSPVAVTSIGIEATTTRVLAFCVSAFLAGIAGGLLGSLTELITPSSFDFFQSLLWLTVLVVAGSSSLGGAVLAAVLLHVVPAVLTSSAVVEYQPIAFGVAAILLAQAPNGIVGLVRSQAWDRWAAQSAWRLERSRGRERVMRLAAAREATP